MRLGTSTLSVEVERDQDHIDGYGRIAGYAWVVDIFVLRLHLFFGWTKKW